MTATAPPTDRAARPRSNALGLLMPPLFLAAIGLGIWFVFRAPADFFLWVAGFLVVLSVVWIAVSALYPRGVAERTCPACGKDALVRTSELATKGVTCSACLWMDEDQSAFFLAEEDEEVPLEQAVLAKRRKRTPLVIRAWDGPDPQAGSDEPDRRSSPDEHLAAEPAEGRG